MPDCRYRQSYEGFSNSHLLTWLQKSLLHVTLEELILAVIPVECHFDRCYRRLEVPNVNVHNSVPVLLFAFSSIIGYATGDHRGI